MDSIRHHSSFFHILPIVLNTNQIGSSQKGRLIPSPNKSSSVLSPPPFERSIVSTAPEHFREIVGAISVTSELIGAEAICCIIRHTENGKCRAPDQQATGQAGKIFNAQGGFGSYFSFRHNQNKDISVRSLAIFSLSLRLRFGGW